MRSVCPLQLASKEGEEEEEEEGGGAPPTEPASKHTSSIGGASFNFINSIIGAGIIGGWGHPLCMYLYILVVASQMVVGACYNMLVFDLTTFTYLHILMSTP